MPEQQSFMTRILPDEPYTQLPSQGDRPIAPERIGVTPVGIQKNEESRIRTASVDTLANLALGCFDNRQRIAATKRHQVQMKALMAFIEEAGNEGSVTALAFTLAADEDPPSWRYMAATHHPICGTAP